MTDLSFEPELSIMQTRAMEGEEIARHRIVEDTQKGFHVANIEQLP